MKAIPLLVITNALALGLAILLFVRQDDLKSQVASARSTAPRATVGEDTSELQRRIETLERQLRDMARGGAVPAASPYRARMTDPADAMPAAAMPAGEADVPEPIAEDAPAAEMPPAQMEAFRQHVRKAIELNGEEDRVKRVEDSLDELVTQNRIAPLSSRQRTHIANTILSYREKMPQIWQRMRTMPEGTSREERGQIIRQEFDTLRAEAQKQIEEVVPAADAKVILEAQVREAPGMFAGGPGRRGDGGGMRGGR